MRSKTLKSKNAVTSSPISTLASFELFDVLPCSFWPDNGVSLGSILVPLHTSDIIFDVKSCKSCCFYINHLSCNSYYVEYQMHYRKDNMSVEYMFSQPYWSLIESQNCCLGNSNPNSVTGSTVNLFGTPVKVDIFTTSFSLSFISVVKLSMMLLLFSSIDFFVSQFWVSLDYLQLYCTVNFFS